LGLRARYGDSSGGFGKTILLAGVIGMPVPYLGVASMAFLSASAAQQAMERGWWVLLFGGPVVPLLALTLFGLTALRSKPMPQLNGLPVFAGIWYPALYLWVCGLLFTRNGNLPSQDQAGFAVVLLMQVIALCAFGGFLASDAPQEMAAA